MKNYVKLAVLATALALLSGYKSLSFPVYPNDPRDCNGIAKYHYEMVLYQNGYQPGDQNIPDWVIFEANMISVAMFNQCIRSN